MKKELIHFVRWELIPEEQVEQVISQLPLWGIENIVSHPKWFRDNGENHVLKIKKLLEQNGLRSTACHALWGIGNDCIDFDQEIRSDMIRRQKLFLTQLQELNIRSYTIHLGYKRKYSDDENFSVLRKTIDELLPCCEETGITLALENSGEPLSVIRSTCDMISEYDHDKLGMCFDSGHANCYGGGVQKVLDIMKEHIVTCHLHDNYGKQDDHNPPGEGNINWQELNRLLDTLPRLYHAETEAGVWDRTTWEKFCHALGKNRMVKD